MFYVVKHANFGIIPPQKILAHKNSPNNMYVQQLQYLSNGHGISYTAYNDKPVPLTCLRLFLLYKKRDEDVCFKTWRRASGTGLILIVKIASFLLIHSFWRCCYSHTSHFFTNVRLLYQNLNLYLQF